MPPHPLFALPGDAVFLDYTVDDQYERISTDEIHEKMKTGTFLVRGLHELKSAVNDCSSGSEHDSEALGACVYLETLSQSERTPMSVLAIHPSIQGNAVSLSVLDTAFLFAKERGYQIVESDVLSVKPWLVDFYRKHGWELTGEAMAWPANKLRYVKPQFKDAADTIHLLMEHSTDIQPASAL